MRRPKAQTGPVLHRFPASAVYAHLACIGWMHSEALDGFVFWIQERGGLCSAKYVRNLDAEAVHERLQAVVERFGRRAQICY